MATKAKTTKTTAKRRSSKTKTPIKTESDSAYVLKLVMYLIIGSLWVRITPESGGTPIPLPVGFVIGALFAVHDHFQIDRKIEYALLLVAAFIGFWLPIGIYITL